MINKNRKTVRCLQYIFSIERGKPTILELSVSSKASSFSVLWPTSQANDKVRNYCYWRLIFWCRCCNNFIELFGQAGAYFQIVLCNIVFILASMNARYIGKFVVILRNFVLFYLCMVDLNTTNISSQTLSQPNRFSLSHFHFSVQPFSLLD